MPAEKKTVTCQCNPFLIGLTVTSDVSKKKTLGLKPASRNHPQNSRSWLVDS